DPPAMGGPDPSRSDLKPRFSRGFLYLSVSYRQSRKTKSAPDPTAGPPADGPGLSRRTRAMGAPFTSKKVRVSEVKAATSVTPALYLERLIDRDCSPIAGCRKCRVQIALNA